MNGGQIILEVLKHHGVDTLFGYPGGAVIPFYDTLYDYQESFNHYRTAHEQGAIHAADGYARTTGKVGVCIATSGPGATNTITGIATAYMDSIPLVVITGQVPSSLLGRDSFQEIDITGVTFSITKHNFLVKSVEEVQQVMEDAIRIATTGRPGPVVVDIPKDFFVKTCELKAFLEAEKPEALPVKYDALNEAVYLIENSKRPVIYAGGGVKPGRGSDVLNAFARRNNIPVVNTLMGLGTFDLKDDLALGIVGMHGSPEANMAIVKSDLIISIGARFSDRVTGNVKAFQQNKKIIQIDIDHTEHQKNIMASVFLNGTVETYLGKLLERVRNCDRHQWLSEIQSYKVEERIEDHTFTPSKIIHTLNNEFSQREIVVTDVGQHQMWTAQHYKFSSPKSFVTSGGLGTMGFGLGAAIGAQIGNEDKTAVLITGDGSFRMNCNELSTVSTYNIPLVMVMMNNGALGMVRQWQKMFQNERYAETTLSQDVDYVKLLSAYNIPAYRVKNIETLEHVLKLRDPSRPFFVECIIDQDQDVLPIVPPGKPIEEFIIE
jgi:acetolactate synthase-1/2/3 large subunit